jgi:hypothetical protein
MGRRAHAWSMLLARLVGLLAVALLSASACGSDKSKGIFCSLRTDGQYCSCSVDNGGTKNTDACGDNLMPAATCCALPGWPATGGCSCSASSQPGLGECVAPLFKVTRCEPAGAPVEGPDSSAPPPVCQAGASLPDSQVCCGGAPCDLATQTCCITAAPPMTLSCTAKGASCAGMAKGCNGPGDCTGNACCVDSHGSATCASGTQCPPATKPVCKTAADCSADAANCCGIDLTLVPMGHFIYGVCQSAC